MDELQKEYLLTVDIGMFDDEKLRQFLLFIASNKLFSDWHSPFTGFFILRSESDSEEIATNISNYLGDSVRLFVTRTTRGASYGFVAEQTWDWIRQAR